MSRRLSPGVPDVVFGLVLVSVLIGGRYRLLNDPGTPWHLRLGREIVRTGEVPRVDSLTYTRAGHPWVDQSWLFDAALARVIDLGGWSAAALVAAVTLGAIYGSLAQGLLRDGRTPLVALGVAVLAASVGSIHFLVRPHLVTLGLVLVTLRCCQAQHERGGYRVFGVPCLTVLWANVHGGFLAAPVIVFTSALGHAVSGRWDAARRRGVGAFVAAGVLCLPAALVNPYGFGLYRHVGRLLVSSGVTELIDEYQPIPFGRHDARAVECVVLALIALPALTAARMTRYELAHALVWLHLSLASVRHAPLFALAVAPGLARLAEGVMPRREGEDSPGLPDWSVWPAAAAAGLGVAVAAGATLGGFDPAHWPVSALPEVNRAAPAVPVFHEQDWGGLIESECRPPRRAFIDDRFELHGKEAVLRYGNAIEGGPDWDLVRDRERIGLVWVRPGRGLARRLDRDASWLLRFRDEVSVVYARRQRPADEPPAGSPSPDWLDNPVLWSTIRDGRGAASPDRPASDRLPAPHP